jgi:hypothetical protein
MVHFPHWTERAPVRNLSELQDQIQKRGGAIVQYEVVISPLVFSCTRKYLEWVPPYQSRWGIGFKYALWCLAVGWWSLPGLFLTPPAIINNVMGGADVTGLVISEKATPETRAAAKKELKKVTERFGLVILFLFLLVIAGIFLIAAYR